MTTKAKASVTPKDKRTGIEFVHSCGHVGNLVDYTIYRADRYENGTVVPFRSQTFYEMADIAEYNERHGTDYRFVREEEVMVQLSGNQGIRRVQLSDRFAKKCPACRAAAKKAAEEAKKAEVVAPVVTPAHSPEVTPEATPTVKKSRGRPRGSRNIKNTNAQQDQSTVSVTIERDGKTVQWTGSMSQYTSAKKVRSLPAIHTCGHFPDDSKLSLKGLRKEAFYDKYVETYSHECPMCVAGSSVSDADLQTLDLPLYAEPSIEVAQETVEVVQVEAVQEEVKTEVVEEEVELIKSPLVLQIEELIAEIRSKKANKANVEAVAVRETVKTESRISPDEAMLNFYDSSFQNVSDYCEDQYEPSSEEIGEVVYYDEWGSVVKQENMRDVSDYYELINGQMVKTRASKVGYSDAGFVRGFSKMNREDMTSLQKIRSTSMSNRYYEGKREERAGKKSGW